MLNTALNLNSELFVSTNFKSTRDAFGAAMVALGEKNPNVVALCADLTDSVKLGDFAQKFPSRFFQVGIAEQNMAGLAAGLALGGKKVFMASHAGFIPGQNWNQIRMSICMNKANVVIIGSHGGFSNGPDGAPDGGNLEDLALTRVLPNMIVVNPIDYEQTIKVVLAAADHVGPMYIRLCKQPTPEITTVGTEFEVGAAQVVVEGKDGSIFATGPIIFEALLAARELKVKHKIDLEVVSVPTIKPLDAKTILESVKKTGLAITLEEHQKIGGLGSAVAELLGEQLPTKLIRMGMDDRFGESGSYRELVDKFGLNASAVVSEVLKALRT